MKRFFFFALMAVVAALVIAAGIKVTTARAATSPAPSSARVTNTLHHICLLRDHNWGVDLFQTRPPSGSATTIRCANARDFYWVQAGTDDHGVHFGFLESIDGFPLAALDCGAQSGGLQLVHNTSDNGTVWQEYVDNSNKYYSNRFCSGGAKHYQCVLSTVDAEPAVWGLTQHVHDPRHAHCPAESGFFSAIDHYVPSS